MRRHTKKKGVGLDETRLYVPSDRHGSSAFAVGVLRDFDGQVAALLDRMSAASEGYDGNSEVELPDIVVAYIVMAYIVMAYSITACVVMPYI